MYVRFFCAFDILESVVIKSLFVYVAKQCAKDS